MKRIGIYIRVSTEEQARVQEGSLSSQKNRLLEYIEFKTKEKTIGVPWSTSTVTKEGRPRI